jgi:hypothetical protein
MKVRILTSAFNDLAAGRRFYDKQGEGLGNYFLNSVFADIDSLALYAGIHRKILGQGVSEKTVAAKTHRTLKNKSPL